MITTQLASLLIAASVLTAAPVVQARDSIDVRIAEASERLATLSASAAALHPEVRYSEAVGELGLSQMVLRTVGVIEIVREFVIQNLVGLQGGLTIEAKTCDTPNAFWDSVERRITLCYELVDYHADLARSLIPER